MFIDVEHLRIVTERNIHVVRWSHFSVKLKKEDSSRGHHTDEKITPPTVVSIL